MCAKAVPMCVWPRVPMCVGPCVRAHVRTNARMCACVGRHTRTLFGAWGGRHCQRHGVVPTNSLSAAQLVCASNRPTYVCVRVCVCARARTFFLTRAFFAIAEPGRGDARSAGFGVVCVRDMRVDMCVYMRVDMCVYMCVDMCVDMRVDTRVDMCVYMRVDTRVDMCVYMRVDMCVYMHVDMRVDTRVDM